MIRTVLGFSVFAVVGVLAMKLLFSVLGGVLSLIGTVLVWAFWGFIFYLILKVVAPDTASRVKEVITGRPA